MREVAMDMATTTIVGVSLFSMMMIAFFVF
jgi:hypothetical protein